MKISLVCATYGRKDELREFLESLCEQKYKDFEVIVVDQNPPGFLEHVYAAFQNHLNLKVVRSERGLSKARNVGLNYANGEVVGFPDDDCRYYPDTLEQVALTFCKTHAVCILGKIYDREHARNVMRNWPSTGKSLGRFGAYLYGSSICLFARRLSDSEFARMDEKFGVGAQYGCSEDVDYVIRLLPHGALVYVPDVQIWHPELNMKVMSAEKLISYSYGAGALYKKHRLFLIFFCYFCSKLASIVKDICLLNFSDVGKGIASICWRIIGFRDFTRNGQKKSDLTL